MRMNEMTARFVESYQNTSFVNGDVHLHSHSFYEVILCRTSCGAQFLMGQDRYFLQRGDMVFVPPGIIHRPLLPDHLELPYVQDVLRFSTELVQGIHQMIPGSRIVKQDHGWLLRTAGTKWEYVGDLFHTCVQESATKAPGWELSLLGNTLSLMSHIKRAYEDAETVSLRAEEPELLDRAMQYIGRHMAERITLEDLAKHLYVSESTVSQTFRKKMGVSFYRCVTQQRLVAAKAMIQEGHPLEDVSRRVGFADYSGFYRAFRAEYGISPRQFKKQDHLLATVNG